MQMKLKAAAEQKELISVLKALNGMTGDEIIFDDVASTMSKNEIKLVYLLPLTEDEYAETGKDILAVGKKAKNWSCTTQYSKRDKAVMALFSTKISF